MLFWAEIYHQAKSLPSFILRPLFLAINGAVYAAQIGLWIYMGLAPKDRWVQVCVPPATALRTELTVHDRSEPVTFVLQSGTFEPRPFSAENGIVHGCTCCDLLSESAAWLHFV